MPNWCYNRVNVYGDSDTVDQVKEIYEIFENNNDPFHKIFPIPDFKNIPNEKENYPSLNNTRMIRGRLFGKHTIFQMVRMMIDGIIGTLRTGEQRMGCSELCVEYLDDEQLELTFSTAWSPPEGIIEKLREKYPDLSFSCFYDEPGMEVAGYY